MSFEKSNAKKRIPLCQLKPGMYVVDLDRAWIHTPFLFNSKQIKDTREIELLAKHGIREVVIDIERGTDAEPATADPNYDSAVEQPRKATEPAAASRGWLPYEKALGPLIQEISTAKAIHQEALAAAQSVFDGVGRGSALNSPAAKQTVTSLLSSVTRSPEANLLLTQMRRFQNDLFTHAVNVCVLSMVVGTLEGFTEEVSELGLGALLHDVGQVRLPRNLIRKSDRFTDQERRLLEQHPVLGGAILEQADNIAPTVRKIVLEHHERLNGTGYPLKAGEHAISGLSQIVAITDAYDAMITGRNGVLQKPIDVLRELYLEANAGAFDRHLVEKVIRSLGVYPVGSLVELSTGERGIVLAANRKDTLKPTIRLVLTRDGLPLSRGPVVSLDEAESVAIDRRILRTLDPGKERIDIMQSPEPRWGSIGSMEPLEPYMLPASAEYAERAVSQLLLDALPSAALLTDNDGRIVAANGQAELLLGWVAPVLEGQSAHDLFDCRVEDCANGVEECPIEKVLHGGNVEPAARMRIRCRGDSVKQIEYRCVPYPTAKGVGAMLAFHDLTRQTELEKDQRRLASIAEESPIAIVELNEDGNLIHANPAMMSLVDQFGFRADARPTILPSNIVKIVTQCLHGKSQAEGVEVHVGDSSL